MGIIASLILGLISGFIASKIINKSGSGILMDIIIGIVGAFVGGIVMNLIGGHGVTGLNLHSMIVSVIGAVIVLLIYRKVFAS